MLSEEKIDRINQLANKAKTEGLNEEEIAEQTRLRNEYIQSVRSSLKANLETITIVKVDDDGNEIERTALKDKSKKLN